MPKCASSAASFEAQQCTIEDAPPHAQSCCAKRNSTPAPEVATSVTVTVSSCGDHACCDVNPVPHQLNHPPRGVSDVKACANIRIARDDLKTCSSSAPLATNCCASDDCKIDSAIPAPVLEARRLLQICCELCWGAKAYECCHRACCATACCLLDLHAKIKSILNKQPFSTAVDATKDDRAKQPHTLLLSTTHELLLSSPQSSFSSSNLLDETAVVTLAVSGFKCTDCASPVERKLRKLVGVTHVRASAMTGQTEVTYNLALGR